MDIRIEKTRAAIKEAFLSLRTEKPLEKITIKELCRLAQINKSTFYSHYDDIYDLANAIEVETISFILNDISQSEEYSTDNPDILVREIFRTCLNHAAMINLIFSDKTGSHFATLLEVKIKELVYQKYPEYQDNLEKNVLLSFCIQGAHHAYWNNSDADIDTLIHSIETIIRQLQPLYC